MKEKSFKLENFISLSVWQEERKKKKPLSIQQREKKKKTSPFQILMMFFSVCSLELKEGLIS